ncbi:hypothetical protein RYX36_006101 [Vicia faba]
MALFLSLFINPLQTSLFALICAITFICFVFADAATGMYSELTQSNRSLLRHWEQCGQPKIVVTCKNQQEMNKLKETAESVGLPTFVVSDAGRTQVSAGSKTVLAVGPGQLCVALFLTWFMLLCISCITSSTF